MTGVHTYNTSTQQQGSVKNLDVFGYKKKIKEMENVINDLQASNNLLKEENNQIHKENSLLKKELSRRSPDMYDIIKRRIILEKDIAEFKEKEVELQKQMDEFLEKYTKFRKEFIDHSKLDKKK